MGGLSFSQKTFNDRAWQANWQREIEGVYLSAIGQDGAHAGDTSSIDPEG